MLGQQAGEQMAERPGALVLEAGDQRIDREGIAPRRLDALEGRCAAQAAGTHQAIRGQRHGAHPAVRAEPGQLAFAVAAQRQAGIGGQVAEQAVLAAF
ncbi:hypothetical protein D3C80_1311880 [compost metagenome]